MFEKAKETIKKIVNEIKNDENDLPTQEAPAPSYFYREKFNGDSKEAEKYIIDKISNWINTNSPILDDESLKDPSLLFDKKQNLLKEAKELDEELVKIGSEFKEVNLLKNFISKEDIELLKNIKKESDSEKIEEKYSELDTLSLKLSKYIRFLEKNIEEGKIKNDEYLQLKEEREEREKEEKRSFLIFRYGEKSIISENNEFFLKIDENTNININKVATSINEIKEDTIVYIGKIPNEKDIYKKLKNIEYLYANFPNKRIEIITHSQMEYPKITEEFIKAFIKKGLEMIWVTVEMLKLMENTIMPEGQKFIKLTVEDLFGDTNTHTYEEILKKAKELGLELCEQDDGPKLRLSTEQKRGDMYRTAMKPINLGDCLCLWGLYRFSGGEEFLDWYDGALDYGWDSYLKFLFRLSK